MAMAFHMNTMVAVAANQQEKLMRPNFKGHGDAPQNNNDNLLRTRLPCICTEVRFKQFGKVRLRQRWSKLRL